MRVSGLVRVLKGVKIDGYTLEKYIEMRVMKALNPGQFGMAGPDFCCRVYLNIKNYNYYERFCRVTYKKFLFKKACYNIFNIILMTKLMCLNSHILRSDQKIIYVSSV